MCDRSMTIADFKNYFKAELSEQYSDSEMKFLCSVFIQKKVGFNPYLQRKFADQELLISDQEELLDAVAGLKSGRPYQHVLGETEFFGMTFSVNEHVLIPRPETEELLELAVKSISKSSLSLQGMKILDIGTGSGVIPLVLKKHFPEADVSSIDFSREALETAKKNALYHKLDINFIHADYLNSELSQNFDIIISNPPYIGIDERDEINDSVKGFEPEMALFSPTSDALIFYRKIARDSVQYLNPNGLLFLEINQKLGPETLGLYTDHFADAQLIKDLSGNDRFIVGIR
ncbi:release factor glutamine methyltransferase [Chryseobacterium sp. SORGH_AS909]|uniref:peptide chain release factor N(5)-glutamine methyltransferase n=2 Tax=Chryseobacterium group TaxID=2782232 RepID=A0ABU0TI04_9FLAO|nr:release factor glutamine methyltransferase [Chryseobacterium camelliae]MDQ1100392.1 release factor glutamine methyltransferase [Chryseobacterium sp. SORGH_AS_1048]MDR6087733.1 release factor glutamine methyltransferase [Chryseobacterium sp. SORGH_AS_0909]MDR6132109.1 release factor glutamine methyltransferase [Chryseobacterium sp. SORGH_AS_1175]MDT3405740.1 release factor glutamine methyltransferase [Pseudacidovorax intermedius]